MGLFSASPARREARLAGRAAKIESKLATVRKDIPGVVAAAALAPKFDNPAQSNTQALTQLREYVVMLDAKQQKQIDALDDDIGQAVRSLKSKAKLKGDGGGAGGMSPLMLILLLGGGLGGTSSSSTTSTNPLLLILLLGGMGGDDDGGGMGGMMGLILLLTLL